MNNSGTINLTNAVLHIEGYFAYYGGLVNQPGGVINLQGSAGLVSSVGYPPSQSFGYIVNQGIINQLAGTNSISAPFFDTTQGTITNLSGTMVLEPIKLIWRALILRRRARRSNLLVPIMPRR